MPTQINSRKAVLLCVCVRRTQHRFAPWAQTPFDRQVNFVSSADTKRLALVRPGNTSVPSSVLQNNDNGVIIKKEAPVFAGSKPIEWHWKKHKDEFPGFTENTHLLRARFVMSAPLEDGVLEQITRSDGSISRYSFADNMFLATTEDGNIRTFFRPLNGVKYWEYEHERNK